jgi:hypothetical protein
MNDQLHLPPEGRLTDQQKAVMRADLLAAIDEQVRRPGRRPWLVPGGVAATVALLVGGGLVLQGSHDRAGTTGVPVAGSDSEAPSQSTPSTGPTTGPTAGPSSTDGTGSVECSSAAFEVATNNQVPIRGDVTVADSVAYDGGRTFLLTVGDKWVICDDWGAYSQPTVFAWHDTTDTAFTKKTFQYSTNNDDGTTQFVAGGAALPGVTAIRYALPTGDVVDATITDHMWQMVFTARLKSFEPFLKHPVVVTVTHTDGSTDRYELGAEDGCAQANHGC